MDDAEREAAFLVQLAARGIRPDMQEVLIRGNPSLGIPPGALRAALRSSRNEVIEMCAKKAESIKVMEGEPSPELLHEMENDVVLACEAAGNITARRIAASIRSLKDTFDEKDSP